jgi:hypothetical protein
VFQFNANPPVPQHHLKYDQYDKNPIYQMLVSSGLQWENMKSKGISQKIMNISEGFTHIGLTRQMGHTTALTNLFLDNNVHHGCLYITVNSQMKHELIKILEPNNAPDIFSVNEIVNNQFRFRGQYRERIQYIFIDCYSFMKPEIQDALMSVILNELAPVFDLRHVFIVQ